MVQRADLPDVAAFAELQAKKRRVLLTLLGNLVLLVLMVGGPWLRGYLRARDSWQAFGRYTACLYGGSPSPEPGLGLPLGSEAYFADLVGGLLCADTLIHTWDLCQAAGLDDELDEAGVDHALNLLISFGPGIRVPAILVGPYVKHGYVDHTQYETVSILTLIEKRWNLSPLSSRDRDALPLQNVFDFDLDKGHSGGYK